VPNILLVDDDKALTNLTKTLLEMEPEGFVVEIAHLGRDALPMIYDNPPDLVILDYNLKDMSGLDLLHQLRQDANTANLPVLVASGLNVENEVMAAGATAFVLKPFEPADLPSIVLNVIGQ